MKFKKMSLGEAICVMEDYLDDANFPLATKVKAVEMVAHMETHNSITKTKLVNALRFLFKTFDFATDNNDGHKPMTNGDRIRAMTDEELAAVMVKGDLHFCTIAETDCIYGWHTPNCIAHALKWLQQHVKEDET